MSVIVKETKNYNMFELHPFNRDLGRVKFLEKSMREHGWIDAYPMHVFRNGNGKLKIKAGHHRFHVARILGIPVKYVESNDKATIDELERATNTWSNRDFLNSFVRLGEKAYVELAEYQKKTGIPLAVCISILAGNETKPAKVSNRFRSGIFQIKDTVLPFILADIVGHCKRFGISCSSKEMFVRALYRIIQVEGFDCKMLKQKIATFPAMVKAQTSVEEYQQMLEGVYNHANRKKVPLSFMANEAAKKRSAVKS